MMELMNRLSDKPNWERKVFDEAIATKWRAEALATPDVEISERMVEWVSIPGRQARQYLFGTDFIKRISELRYKAKLFKQTNCIEALDGVFKSDTIVPEDVKKALQKAAACLEDVPAKDKDWRPGSNEQVLDLVHPSIYPLVYEQSRILPNDTVGLDDCMRRCGEGRVPPFEGTFFDNRWSDKYQWLPSELLVPEGSDQVKYVYFGDNLESYLPC